jgi:hypothetical protein
MKMNFFYHLNFLKQDKSPLKLFWKITISHRKIIKWKIKLCWTSN